MAARELEILIRARDNAGSAFKSLGDAATKAGKQVADANAKMGKGGIADSIKGFKKSGLNEGVEQFGSLIKGGGVIAAVVQGFHSIADSVISYKQAMKDTGDDGLSRLVGAEAFVKSIPLVGGIFEKVQSLAGQRPFAQQVEDVKQFKEQIIKSRAEIVGLTSQMEQMSLGIKASDSRFSTYQRQMFGVEAESVGQKAGFDQKIAEANLERAKLQKRSDDGEFTSATVGLANQEMELLNQKVWLYQKLKVQSDQILDNRKKEMNDTEVRRQQGVYREYSNQIAQLADNWKTLNMQMEGNKFDSQVYSIKAQVEAQKKQLEERALNSSVGKSAVEKQFIRDQTNVLKGQLDDNANLQLAILKQNQEKANANALDDHALWVAQQMVATADINNEEEVKRLQLAMQTLQVQQQFNQEREKLNQLIENATDDETRKKAMNQISRTYQLEKNVIDNLGKEKIEPTNVELGAVPFADSNESRFLTGAYSQDAKEKPVVTAIEKVVEATKENNAALKDLVKLLSDKDKVKLIAAGLGR